MVGWSVCFVFWYFMCWELDVLCEKHVLCVIIWCVVGLVRVV